LNFKIILFFLVALHLSACGVKAPPYSPPETAVSSYIETYTGTPLEESKSEAKKKK
jgi:predicted small lipoprotein YifL